MHDLGWRLLSASDRAREYSPSSCIDDVSLMLGAYATNETTQFKRQSAAMAAALRAAGVEVDEVEASARNHFDLVFDLCDQNTELGRRLLNLVDQTRRHEPM